MTYQIKGSLLEVCDCKVLCPCWIGEDPDNGSCRGVIAHHIDAGRIDDIDVSGLTVAILSFIPGNILKGGWRVALFIDERATPAQFEALLAVYKGERGGPVGDLVKLVGEVVEVRRAPIRFDVKNGHGSFAVGTEVQAEVDPYRGPGGELTHLVDTIFSTIPGSPAYVAKATRYRAQHAGLGINVDLTGHNAIQGHFSFEA